MFVPDDFEVPTELDTPLFSLRPLAMEHNGADHAAWMSSIDHIRSAPGFPDGRWPRPMTLDENAQDIERHASHFRERRGFTYTVLRDGDVIGCVYIYPRSEGGASVQSWVRASHAEFDRPLYETVVEWLDKVWPFVEIEYVGRN